MRAAIDTIAALRSRGYTVSRAGNGVRLRGPIRLNDAALRQAVVAHKLAILEVLKDEDAKGERAASPDNNAHGRTTTRNPGRLLCDEEVGEFSAQLSRVIHHPACPGCGSVAASMLRVGNPEERCARCRPAIRSTRSRPSGKAP